MQSENTNHEKLPYEERIIITNNISNSNNTKMNSQDNNISGISLNSNNSNENQHNLNIIDTVENDDNQKESSNINENKNISRKDNKENFSKNFNFWENKNKDENNNFPNWNTNKLNNNIPFLKPLWQNNKNEFQIPENNKDSIKSNYFKENNSNVQFPMENKIIPTSTIKQNSKESTITISHSLFSDKIKPTPTKANNLNEINKNNSGNNNFPWLNAINNNNKGKDINFKLKFKYIKE